MLVHRKGIGGQSKRRCTTFYGDTVSTPTTAPLILQPVIPVILQHPRCKLLGHCPSLDAVFEFVKRVEGQPLLGFH
jgi:hypothetical protein